MQSQFQRSLLGIGLVRFPSYLDSEYETYPQGLSWEWVGLPSFFNKLLIRRLILRSPPEIGLVRLNTKRNPQELAWHPAGLPSLFNSILNAKTYSKRACLALGWFAFLFDCILHRKHNPKELAWHRAGLPSDLIRFLIQSLIQKNLPCTELVCLLF